MSASTSAPASSVKQLWQRYVAWFYARQPRERLIIAVVLVFVPLVLGNNLVIEPAMMRAQKARQQVMQLPAATETLRQQTQAFIKQANDPDQAMRSELERLTALQAEQQQRFREVERNLIPPAQMIGLLESLLKRSHGLELISLNSLPPEPVGKSAEKVADKAVSAATDNTAQLYKHGVEIALLGSYLDLLAYLEALEADAPNLIWGNLAIEAKTYPRTVMRVRVYSLSIDRSWLML